MGGADVNLEEISDAPGLVTELAHGDEFQMPETAAMTPVRRAALEALEREFRDLLVPQL
jgi:hypothetical protein